MIGKETYKIISEERIKLLEEKSKLGFLKRIFFRKYTDWLLINDVRTLI